MAHMRFTVRAVIMQLFVTVALCAACRTAVAEETKPAPTATPLPQRGSIASTESGGFGQTSKDQWGGTALDGPNAAPISGSVSSGGQNPRTWLLKLFNNSKDSYTVDVAVVQLSRTGGTVRTDNYSVPLAPGATIERKIPAQVNSISAAVNMRGWKKTSKAPEPTPTVIAVKTAAPKDSDNEEELPPPPPRKRIR